MFGVPSRSISSSSTAAWSRCVLPEQGRCDLVGRCRRLPDALAAVAALLAVAKLDCLVGAGRRSGRHSRPPDAAVGQHDHDLDGGVAARVEDLVSVDELDLGHDAAPADRGCLAWSTVGRGAGVLQDGDAGQHLALEELEAGAAAGRDVREAIGELQLLDRGHGVTAADHDRRAVVGLGREEARHGARAVPEGGHLEDAQRAVPEDRLGGGQGVLA